MLMKATSEKKEDIEQYELEALKEIKKTFSEEQQSSKSNNFVKGILWGLTFGVGFALFIQFLYLGNWLICALSIIVIALASIFIYKNLSQQKTQPKISRKNMDIIDYAIKRREHELTKKESQAE